MKKLVWKITHKKKPNIPKEWKYPLLSIFYTLKILGRFPFKQDESGKLGVRLLSAPSLWALVATSFQVVFVVNIYFWKFTNPRNWSSFNLIIASLQELIILNTAFHSFATWSDTPAIARAFNRWLTFHKEFYTKIGRQVVSPILNHSSWGIVLSFLWALAVVIQTIVKPRDKVETVWLGPLRKAYYGICIFYFTIIVWCWVVHCLVVGKSAEIFKQHISQTFSHQLTSHELAELRSLWLELHACTVDMSDALGRTFYLWQGVSYLLTLFSLYAGLMYVFVDNSLQLAYIPHALVHSHVCFIIVYTLGHFAQQRMTDNILFLLYSKRWQHFSSPVRNELDLLLDGIEMSSPCFRVQGVLTLNRRGYVAILNGIFTYLVIFMQIKVSADGTT